MATIRAQVTLKTVDAVSENFVSNNWAFSGTNPQAETVGIASALQVFYSACASYLSPAIAQNAHEIKMSNLPGTPPNYPFYTTAFNLSSAPAGSPLPSEVATCLSFQGDKAAGFPQARRRGRIFIGPLDTTALDASGRPAAAMLTAITAAASTFRASITALGTDTYWSIWSVTDQAPVEVLNGWMDNAFDTQRRRGIDRTSRTTFT